MGLRWGVPGDERPIWRFRKGWCFSFVGALVMLVFPGGSDGKASAYNVVGPGLNPWVGKILWRRKWQPTPVPLPGKSHGRILVGYSPWGCRVGHN